MSQSIVRMTMHAALSLMARDGFRLVCHAGLGIYLLRAPRRAEPIAIAQDVAEALLENGLVSLDPEASGDDLVFLLTAEGRRQGRDPEAPRPE